MQSSLHSNQDGPHVAVIMDGNGRWARARGLLRIEGHRVGRRVVESIVPAADKLGLPELTLFAFSTHNWKRPAAEVAELMRIFARYFWAAARALPALGIRLEVLGRRDRVTRGVIRAVEAAEAATEACDGMRLRFALDYSSRAEIARAAGEGGAAEGAIAGALRTRDVDLLIRTGGERRLSDFMLYELAQAELVFLDRPWPEFRPRDLENAVEELQARNRTFGGLHTGEVRS